MDILGALLIIVLLVWLLVGQPVVQVLLLLRVPRERKIKVLGLIGLFIHGLFIVSLGHIATLEGIFNISGHGGPGEMPPYPFELMPILLVSSILAFVVFIVAINDAKKYS